MAEVAACPDCGGEWLDGLRWQHRIDCGWLASLGATQAADFFGRRSGRAATPAELAMLAVRGWTPDLGPVEAPTARVVVDSRPGGVLWTRQFRVVSITSGATLTTYDPELTP